ncbi:Gfo/Idh/MocA family protein [Alienimonas sp. DA493]|uniref:Gfo/Idh/MocA family protein n=1 Tax=Alienimonas sp. DA493 TaxID=3373605 RepID=UPI003754434C
MTHAVPRPTTRRRFLAAAAASAVAGPAFARSTDSRLRVGLIGCGVRGRYLIASLPPTARIAAVCDCATSRMTETLRPTGEWADLLGDWAAADGSSVHTFQDYRRLIDAGGLDAVIVATPDHHHVPAATHALEAGLHVYLEKPVSVCVAEGRELVEAVRRSGRALQVGSQQRSMAVNRTACEFVAGGGLGAVERVELPNYPGPLRDPVWPAEPVPPGLDWDLFLGDTPRRPHNRHLWVKDRFAVDGVAWRGWDLYRTYSGHLTTNWGAHSVDMVQFALAADGTGPVSIEPLPPGTGADAAALQRDFDRKWHRKTPPPEGGWAAASRFHPVRLTYADGVTVEFRPGVKDATVHGARGALSIPRNNYRATPPTLLPRPSQADRAVWEGRGFVARPHLQNWLDAIAGTADLTAPAEVGHRTATVCHLVNLARELSRPLRWDPTAERFKNDPAANALLSREPAARG